MTRWIFPISSGVTHEKPRKGRRPAWLLWFGLGVYVLTFLVLYPRIFAIFDEDAYLTGAYLYRTGRLHYDESGIPPPHMTVNMSGRLVSKYPPGNSLFLVPFTLLPGWRLVFASGLLLALAGTWLFRLTLKELEPDADPAWSLLFLAYPSLVLFSRTLMSDLPATIAVLAGFYLLLRNYHWSSGLLVGAGILVRYSNAVFAPVFLIIIGAVARPRVKALVRFGLGVVVFALLAAGYNAYAYGGPFRFPMYATGEFSLAFLPRNLAFYAANLALVYPLMLIAPLWAGRRSSLLLGLPGYSVLLLYSLFSYLHLVPSLAETALVSMRYILPAVPFFVLGFCIALARLETRLNWVKWAKYLLILGAVGASVPIQYRHDRMLQAQDRYRRLLYAAVPERALLVCNKDVSELVSHAWGRREYVHLVEFGAAVPLAHDIEARDTVYAALLQKPGRGSRLELSAFETLVRDWPDSETVIDEERPCRFRVCRLKPTSGPEPKAGPDPASQARPRERR